MFRERKRGVFNEEKIQSGVHGCRNLYAGTGGCPVEPGGYKRAGKW